MPVSGALDPASGKLSTLIDGANKLLSDDDDDDSSATDGVLSWGYWEEGKKVYATHEMSLHDLHYVVGQPTSAADINSLIGTASYVFISGTAPTSSQGESGHLSAGGMLHATFSGGVNPAQVSFSGLQLTIGGESFVSGGGAGVAQGKLSPLFQGSGSIDAWQADPTGASAGRWVPVSLDFKGFFAGADASRAGVSYRFNGGSLGSVSGALGYKKQ